MAEFLQCIYCGSHAWEIGWGCHVCGCCTVEDLAAIGLTPSADVPACRDEDPAHAAALAACYPDPHDYDHATHPEELDGDS